MDAAFTDEAFDHGVFVGIEEAEKMNAILADSLKAAKCKKSCLSCCGHQRNGVLYSIVVCYPDDFSAGFQTSLNDRRVVICFRLEGGFLCVSLQIGKRIDLKSAAIETCSIGKG